MKKRKLTLYVALLLAVCICAGLIPASAAAESKDCAPVAENLELETYKGVSVGGRLSAIDPDGGVLTYEITTKPVKGCVELLEDGQFVYTPEEGKKGRDYFGYKAVDSDGNYSQEATVIIRIVKQNGCVTYYDMEGHGNARAAVALAENDIYVGRCVGGKYVFSPDEEVSRGEFLAMCMKLANESILTGVTRTGFADDSSIPAWIKPYVSTALMNGVISGYPSDGTGSVFSASEPVTWSEAAVMLDNVLDISDVAYTAGVSEDYVPSWSYQATVNLTACSIMDCPVSSMDRPITRADAASLLANAMDILSVR